MPNFLEKIREKSAEEKKMIAITTSGVVVGFIFFYMVHYFG